LLGRGEAHVVARRMQRAAGSEPEFADTEFDVFDPLAHKRRRGPVASGPVRGWSGPDGDDSRGGIEDEWG
jgi:hypothetical protein